MVGQTIAVANAFFHGSANISSFDEDTAMIRPGQVWRDTNGKRIHAHGGSVHHDDGTFFWYGENKEQTIPGSGVWHWGVRCYSSTDLSSWTDLGLIIPPDLDDLASPLHPAQKMDRPHIIYNEASRKFVCWLKVMQATSTSPSTRRTGRRTTTSSAPTAS